MLLLQMLRPLQHHLVCDFVVTVDDFCGMSASICSPIIITATSVITRNVIANFFFYIIFSLKTFNLNWIIILYRLKIAI